MSINIVKENFLINDSQINTLRNTTGNKINRNNKPKNSIIRLPFINENMSKNSSNCKENKVRHKAYDDY